MLHLSVTSVGVMVPIILFVIDCFLKGKYGGKLLSVVDRDVNYQLPPLAYAVVEVENKETWTWFLKLLIGDLGGIDVCGTMTFMSDQQKVCLIYVQFINFLFNVVSTNNLIIAQGLVPVI